jgi:hypothetical protein
MNQSGENPVWMTIEIDTGEVGNRTDNTVYQFVPTTNPLAWHTVDAATGRWQQWADNQGTVTGPLMLLSGVARAHTGLNVVRAYLRLGMGDSYHGSEGLGTVAWVDKATLGGVTYDFVVDITPPVVTVPANITVDSTGPGGVVVTFVVSAFDDIDGVLTPTCSPASGATFPLGVTTVTCTATDSSQNEGSATFTVTVAIKTYALTVIAVNGTVAKAPNQALYNHGTTVALTATPASGYHFVNWSGAVNGTANPINVVMDGPKSVTANFAYYPFAKLIIAEAKIDWGKKTTDDRIMVKGAFTLPPTSDGLKPGDPVTISVDGFSQTITMVVKDAGKKWEYNRAKGDTGIKTMKLDLSKSVMSFEMHVDKLDMAPMNTWTNPVPISLQIGDDKGTTTVLMRQLKESWEYHK